MRIEGIELPAIAYRVRIADVSDSYAKAHVQHVDGHVSAKNQIGLRTRFGACHDSAPRATEVVIDSSTNHGRYHAIELDGSDTTPSVHGHSLPFRAPGRVLSNRIEPPLPHGRSATAPIAVCVRAVHEEQPSPSAHRRLHDRCRGGRRKRMRTPSPAGYRGFSVAARHALDSRLCRRPRRVEHGQADACSPPAQSSRRCDR